MSYSITGTTITLTRGDTFEALVSATKKDGTPYIPVEGDVIRFAMKENYDDARPLLVKEIPIDTMMLMLEPSDTADLNFGKYVYDIQLTKANGKVDTFITKATLKLSEGSEMATDEDIDNLIDDIFGPDIEPSPDEPVYDSDDIATDEELDDVLTDVFG